MTERLQWNIITGASNGIGKALAEVLSSKQMPIIMACRNIEKAAPIQQHLIDKYNNRNIKLIHIDLSSLASIEHFAQQLQSENYQIQRLINNAGVMNGEKRITIDGFEENLAVNYISPYLLSRLLAPTMIANSQIINTSSITYKIGRVGIDLFDPNKPFTRFSSYSSSKQAILLFSLALARHYPHIRVETVDPGVVSTGMIHMNRWYDPIADLLFRPFVKTALQGAAPTLHLISHPETTNMKEGYWWKNRQSYRLPPSILHHPYKEWLWKESEALLSDYLDGQGY